MAVNAPTLKDGSPLEMVSVRADPATTPRRLYQLFASRGGGVVVFLKESADRLVRKYGWTAQPIRLLLAEARYLHKTTGKDLNLSQKAWLVRCDGVARESEPGTVVCGAPSGLDRAVIKASDVAKASIAPAEQYVPASLMEAVFAFTVDPSAPAILPATKARADLAMRAYRQVEVFYRAYANALAALPQQGAPDQMESNQMTLVRNTLARLAQPVSLLRKAVGASSKGLAPAPMLVGKRDSFVGAVFVATDTKSAFRLMGASMDEVEDALAVVTRMRGPVCKRVSALLDRGLVRTKSQREAVALLQALDCPPDGDGSWKSWAALGGGVMALGFSLHLWRRRELD
jgi:hypothetical protein